MSPVPVTPKLTVDIIAISGGKETRKIVLIERKNEPFGWALPGGFVDVGETLEEAAKRELFEETNAIVTEIDLFQIYDSPTRDPRGHNVSAVFITVLTCEDNTLKAKDDAKDLKLFTLDELPSLAFDHAQIINDLKIFMKW